MHQKILLFSIFFLIFTNSSYSAALAQNKDDQASSTQQQNNKIRIQDSHGKWAFDKPPERIAVINWTLTEQLFELGITPVAVADLKGFQKISPSTLLPDNPEKISDLGSRFEPKLELLKESQPELIIIGYSQRDLMRTLSNIAPVMYFNNFSRRNDNLERADQHFLTLAKLFNKTELAEAKLKRRDSSIKSMQEQLVSHFEDKKQPIPFMTIVSQKNEEIWAYLNNSIPYGVLTKLGFTTEIVKDPSKLGTHKLSNKQLEQINGCLIFINNQASTIQNKFDCQFTAKNTNTFGGAMSQLYLAESIFTSLIQ